jgi:3-deoxy-D-manno-octulosonic-acid transferase
VLALYRFIVGVLFYLGLPILLPVVLISGRHRRGMKERLGFYEPALVDGILQAQKRCWIHAASIGEVRAAAVLIDRLREQLPGWEFLVTTMTIHGRDFARQNLGPEVACQLAPLDVPYSVNRAVAVFRPDLYVCLETELWPVLFDTLRRREVPALLINGRMSARSVSTYRRFKFLFAPVLNSFRCIAVISEVDRQRFMEAGADPDLIVVTGNIKDDTRLPDNFTSTAARWAEVLNLPPKADVFIAGSTHHPEEELLLPLVDDFISRGGIAVIAPRHLDRLAEIESMISGRGVKWDRLSELKNGGDRSQPLVLVDTFGDLGELYSVAAFVFVGGSLSGSGGHNAMEPAIWGRAVFFGPDMADFKEAAITLEKCGGGFRVDDIDDLAEQISLLQQDRKLLAHTGKMAGKAARQQQGAAGRQAELIRRSLSETDTPQHH